MSINTLERPVTIAFDGPHRSGKGTQCRALSDTFNDIGVNNLTVRGDGTRDGQGVSAGDPFSLEWQFRNKYIKSERGGSVEDWNASSFVLIKELALILNEGREKGIDAIIIDRSLLSRAAFLLHRGVGMLGKRLTLEELYPDNKRLPEHERLDLTQLVPDIIFDLEAKSPLQLLARLDENDPKYLFRSRNIKGGHEFSLRAKSHLPTEIEARVHTLQSEDSPEAIHNNVISHLAKSAIASYIKL